MAMIPSIDGLFERFMYETLDEQRWGFFYHYDIPFEKRHGKFLDKMKVAFYCGATDYSHKDIAMKTGVPYGVVRKWNSVDKLFKKIRDDIPKSFIDWYGFRLGIHNDVINIIRDYKIKEKERKANNQIIQNRLSQVMTAV